MNNTNSTVFLTQRNPFYFLIFVSTSCLQMFTPLLYSSSMLYGTKYSDTFLYIIGIHQTSCLVQSVLWEINSCLVGQETSCSYETARFLVVFTKLAPGTWRESVQPSLQIYAMFIKSQCRNILCSTMRFNNILACLPSLLGFSQL